MARDNDTGDLTQASAGDLIATARQRLRSALELLGEQDETGVLNENVVGAGILAHDAGDVLEALFEHRLHEGRVAEASDG